MLNVVVLVSGGGTNLQAIIDAVKGGTITNVKLSAVISNKPDAYALKRAEQNGIPGVCVSRKAYETRAEFEDALLAAVDKFNPDLIVLAGFLVILPEKMTEKYSHRIINIHPSLIPSFCGDGYYGLHVHEKVLARGVKVTGATVHFVDAGTDTGPILLQKAVVILPGDTPEVLQRRVMEQAEWIILPKAIDAIANNRVKEVGGAFFIEE
ncbi:MAG: phosphoribosylglycinamide formyltransferase [Lachnospiraceae bacterium]|nr:phosphoribosylglycinamide formyltransferase [Lachnospiraceae bacterium]